MPKNESKKIIFIDLETYSLIETCLLILILILEIIQSTHFLDPTPQLRSSEYINKFKRQQIFFLFSKINL